MNESLPIPTNDLPEINDLPETSALLHAGSGLTLSSTGISIPTTATPEEITAIADKIGRSHTIEDWYLADVASALMVRAGEHPSVAAKRLGCEVDDLMAMATTSQQWPLETREEGVPTFVHYHVYKSLIEPLGTRDAKERGSEVLRQWRAGTVGPQSLHRTLTRIQRECRDAMQPLLLEVEPVKLTKETKSDSEIPGWTTMFVRPSKGQMLIITLGKEGESSTLRSVEAEAFAAFMDATETLDTAKTWEALAKKVFAEESETGEGS